VGGGAGGGGVGSENGYSANGYTNVQSALRPSHSGSKLRHPQHEGNQKHSLNIYLHVFVYINTFMSACTRTHTHAWFLGVDMCSHTYLRPSSRTYYYAHTHTHAYTHTLSLTSHILATRSSWTLLLKNVRLTHFTMKNSQCICLV